MEGISRRDLLKALGLAGLAGGVSWWGSLPWTEQRARLRGISGAIVGDDVEIGHRLRDGGFSFQEQTPSKKVGVAIIGGGMSGLCAGWRLQKAGMRDFVILERSAQMGGTAKGGERDGQSYPWGAHYVDPPSKDLRALCKIYEDCGVILGYHPVDGEPWCDPKHIVRLPHRNIFSDGVWSQGKYPWHLMGRKDYQELERFEMLSRDWSSWRDRAGKRGFGYPLDGVSQDKTIRRLDQITMADYLKELGLTSEILRWSLNDRCIDEFSLPIESISAWAGMQYYTSLYPRKPLPPPKGIPHHPAIDPIDPTDRKMSWPEGNAFLVRQLMRHLPPTSCKTGQLVLRVRNTQDGVLVTSLDTATQKVETILAKCAIFAAPKYLVYHCVPELATQGRAEFRKLRYVPWIVANLRCRRRPAFPMNVPIAWENFSYRSWSQGYIYADALPTAVLDEDGATTLTFYACLASAPDQERRSLLREGWEFWAGQILDELTRMHPEMPDIVSHIDIFRWGHAMHAAVPGFLFGEERKKMQQPCGQILFAHCDVGGLAVFEQVSMFSVGVAEEAMRRLKHPFSSIL
ncbi:MAG: NAD(P)-binding protein [Myxococcales bacterium]|nr:NAD(P)-binding protein [Myxococcales bacterium]MCB9642939.1 NAD(P)-binding protein [Myxococcales bacterium]